LKIQDSIKQIENIIDCVYNPECYSLTVYVDELFWDKLDRVKIRLGIMLQVKGLDTFFERIIYTPNTLQTKCSGDRV